MEAITLKKNKSIFRIKDTLLLGSRMYAIVGINGGNLIAVSEPVELKNKLAENLTMECYISHLYSQEIGEIKEKFNPFFDPRPVIITAQIIGKDYYRDMVRRIGDKGWKQTEILSPGKVIRREYLFPQEFSGDQNLGAFRMMLVINQKNLQNHMERLWKIFNGCAQISYIYAETIDGIHIETQRYYEESIAISVARQLWDTGRYGNVIVSRDCNYTSAVWENGEKL